MIDPQFVANAIGRMARASLLACVAFSLNAQVQPGTITGVASNTAPRRIQFGLKLYF